MTGIKICGLFRECDIEYVNEAMPDYAGFILHFPKSHRNVEPEIAFRLIKRLRPGIRAVGVFVDQPEETVLGTAQFIGLDVIQLHGREDNEYIARLRERTVIPVWKAFKVRTEEDLKAAEESIADKVLLDNGYGTGTSFDWTVVSGSEGREGLERGFILAGGLTPELIPEAIRLLGPEIVDISSGVETDKVKDRDKILAAVRAARKKPQ